VPSGAFAQTGAEAVTLTSANTASIGNGGVSGDSAVLGIGINISNAVGTKTNATFPSPLAVTITGSFSPTDTVVYYNATTATWATLTGVTVTASEISFNITTDPDIAILAASTTTATTAPNTPVSGATTVHTGKPFFLEEVIAGALILFGLGALVRMRRRRPSTQRG